MTSPQSPLAVTAGPGLKPTRAVLANGLVVLACETKKTPAVTIDLALRAGAVCDPDVAPGTMHLLARVVDRGTTTRTADDIAAELDGRGISLGVGVSRHLFSISCTCLSEHFESVLALLGDIVMNPSLPEREVALRRAEVITSIGQDEDSPYVQASEELMRLLYGSADPYGRRLKGSAATLETIGRNELRRAHGGRFSPDVLTVAIVGDVEPARAVGAVERVFGDWPRVPIAIETLPAVAPHTSRQRVVVPMMNKAQADVAYGFVAIERADPDYYAYSLMNHVLGQYALGGRLGDNIRERQGMAYYVSSSFDGNLRRGPLVIRAGVSPANVDRTIDAIDAELTRARAEGVSQKELDDSRQYLIGSMPRSLETNPDIAIFLQTAAFFGLGDDYDRRLPDLLRAVTRAAVNHAAQMLDPSRAAVVIAGPYETPA